jgi:hypothetical protein
MRKYKNELNVDLIGSTQPLTKDEERAISAYLKAAKLKRAKGKSHKTKSRTQKQLA